MSEVYLGQVMLTGFNYAPRGFALCNGQLMPISQNQALFSLLGTQYGGDGVTTFALPNLQSRVAVGSGNSVDPAWQPSPYRQGQTGGVENVSLVAGEMPSHAHALVGTTAAGGARSPQGNLYGASSGEALYGSSGGSQVPMVAQNIAAAGAGQPHDNMQPYQVINFVIALNGIFPSRN